MIAQKYQSLDNTITIRYSRCNKLKNLQNWVFIKLVIPTTDKLTINKIISLTNSQIFQKFQKKKN